MLSKKQLSYLHSVLMKEKQDLISRLQANDHLGIENAMIKESLGELSNYDNHPADHGSELFEREKDNALMEHAEEQLQDINHALNAMKEGTYGECRVCGDDIPYERLEVLPSATTCVKHSGNQFTSLNRPVEEDILNPPFGKFSFDEQDITMYDSEDSWQDVAKYGTSDSPSDMFDQGKFDYGEMFIEADEPLNYVEPIEEFMVADLYGNFVGISPNVVHDAYEQRLDDEGLMSPIGGIDAETFTYDEKND
ncbi:MAG TPA: yteA family sporulation protein [Bacillota bacterium]|nr:yteA family sporulation protein [Bacillota bacterium]